MANISEMMQGVINGEKWTHPAWVRKCEYGNWHGMYVQEHEFGLGEPRLSLFKLSNDEYISGYVPRTYEIESEKWGQVGECPTCDYCRCGDDDD